MANESGEQQDTAKRSEDLGSRLSYKFMRLRERIRERIERGEISGKLPGERALARRFKVNAKTLSRALTDLAAEGLLERTKGLGTWVRDPAPIPPAEATVRVLHAAASLDPHYLALLTESDIQSVEMRTAEVGLNVEAAASLLRRFAESRAPVDNGFASFTLIVDAEYENLSNLDITQLIRKLEEVTGVRVGSGSGIDIRRGSIEVTFSFEDKERVAVLLKMVQEHPQRFLEYAQEFQIMSVRIAGLADELKELAVQKDGTLSNVPQAASTASSPLFMPRRLKEACLRIYRARRALSSGEVFDQATWKVRENLNRNHAVKTLLSGLRQGMLVEHDDRTFSLTQAALDYLMANEALDVADIDREHQERLRSA
jgi:DNA-binding transcriptional regulator YhcF (GntR family)